GIATGQTGLAYRAAHSLKGAARNVGALELAELTGELEQRLQDENLEADTVRLIVDAEAAMDRLCVQLDVLGL
ncbi:Hpt domain-containing protein, partial [Candidatus Woesearchaeota archaeon]|nr:Hpt domain-containing protein [Candidatus Woesearchaeota archaeon]